MSYIVATRTLTLAGDSDREIVVTVFQPQRDRDDYRCEFEIDGKRGYAMGVDEVQALFSHFRPSVRTSTLRSISKPASSDG